MFSFLPAYAQKPVVLATVNGEEITTDMLSSELGRIHAAQSEEVHRSNFDFERLVNSIINDRLLTQDAYALGLDKEKEVRESVKWFREMMAYQQLLADIEPKNLTVSEDELRAGFERYYRRAMIRLICIPDSAVSASVADSIRSGVSMASLASRHGIDKYAKLGGDAGVYPYYDLPEKLFDRLDAARQGDLIGPVYLWSTWTLIRPDALLPPDPAIYDSVKSVVQEQIINDRATELRKEFIAREGASIPVWADSAAVDSIPTRIDLNTPASKRPVLRVGKDRELLEDDLQSKYVHRYVSRKDRDAREVLWEVFDEQRQIMLMKEIAHERKYVDDPRLDAEALAFQDSLLILHYLESVIAPTVKVSDAEIKEYYDQNQGRFHAPGRVRVAIVTREKLEDAQQDYEKILAGADFAWIAGQYSIDEYRGQGGLRDWESLENIPSMLATRLDTMTIGTCVPPLMGDEGFVVMKLIEREQGPLRPMSEVKDRIRSTIEKKKQFEAIDATISDLRKSSEIVINESAIQSLQNGPGQKN
ncbi:MAG: peptidyl-prolyl cis-trans isomerase [Calditrichaeota bacterium]|nr:peptidyl-prolyl cis-trans isomerase [Calditrichota bacterium]